MMLGGGGVCTRVQQVMFFQVKTSTDESKHDDLMPLSVVKDAAVLNVPTLLLGVLS